MAKEKKKSNKLFAMFVILAFVALVAAGVLLMYVTRLGKHPNAEPPVQGEATQRALYDEIVSRDLIEDYPDTPEDVMALYDKTLFVIYNEKTYDEEMLRDVITVQRRLYAKELLNMNKADVQLQKLMLSLIELHKKGVTIDTIEHEGVEYDLSDKNICSINTVQRLNGENDLFYKYFLQKDGEGKWKIIEWVLTDSEFIY